LNVTLQQNNKNRQFILKSLGGTMNINNQKFKKTLLFSALLLELSLNSTQAITINTDGTTCTLADAITAANSDAATGGCVAGVGDDVLELTSNGTFILTNPLPVIRSNITINGNNSTISKDPNSASVSRILVVSGSSVAPNTSVLTLNNTTISKGFEGNNLGGGIVVRNGAALSLNHSMISENTGGALFFFGAADSTINNSIIDNNVGVDGADSYSGGVNIINGNLTINNSTISNNSSLSNSGVGGGIYVTNYGGNITVLFQLTNVFINNSTISGNFSKTKGGGIGHFFDNTYGGFAAGITVKNTTISGNSSTTSGGGISLDRHVTTTLTNLTLTGNNALITGGGIDMTMFIPSGSTLIINQSLISGNTASSGSEIYVSDGYFTVDNRNIFGTSNVSGIVGITPGATDIIPTVALVDILNPTLTLNPGGTTMTHDLVAGSPAIDSVLNVNCALLADQNGIIRPVDGDLDGNFDCDSGAVEYTGDLIFKDSFE